MLSAERHAYADFDAMIDDYEARGWTDGLPVVPPTPCKVEAFLAAAGLEADAVLGHVPTREVTVTAEHAAINAIMAGCRPEYMPVVVAAVRAHLHEKANCHSTTGTLSGAAQAVIVNGPLRRELGIQCEAGCFGPGFRPNATIGRALRLVIRNACRAIPGFLDRASFSTPLRYSFCFGENEEESPWQPLHAERGLAREASAVTVASVFHLVAAVDFTSRTPEALLGTILETMRREGIAGDRWLGEDHTVVLVVGKEHMRYFAQAGWSKQDLRAYLFARFREDPKRKIGIGRPEGVLIVAAGGAGMAETWILFPHLALAITEVIRPPRRKETCPSAKV